MGRDIYPAMSGGLRAMRTLDIVSNNLANVNTSGFKADRASFVLHRPEGAPGMDTAEGRLAAAYAALDGAVTDYSQGALQPTNLPSDLALRGEDGFFSLEAEPSGAAVLTRDGSFRVDAEGYLAAFDGRRVLSDAGAALEVGTGDFTVHPDGSVTSGEATLGRVAVVDVADRSTLSKAGGNRFFAAAGAVLTPGRAEVLQGQIETSNVEPVRALTELIGLSRYYQAFQKNLEASDQLDQALTDRVGRIDQ